LVFLLCIEVFFEKMSKCQFWVVFQSFPSKLCSGKFWQDFGQIWTGSVILVVAESMPKARLKSLKPSNSSTVNPKATWSGSLESYHSYLLPQKVSKNLQIYCIHSSLPKNAKSRCGFLRTLGDNLETHLQVHNHFFLTTS
jgi:hypothetical protein